MGSSHRDSVAWQKGMLLAQLVYRATEKFPANERFGLTNQMRRASVSIPSNIAEGKGRLNGGEVSKILTASLLTLRAKQASKKQR